MTSGSNPGTLRAIVKELFKVARRVNSEKRFSLYPSTLTGLKWENLVTEAEIEAAIPAIPGSQGGTVLGVLKTMVLDPLVERARQKTLNPTVVTIITDGGDVSSYFRTKFVLYALTNCFGPQLINISLHTAW